MIADKHITLISGRDVWYWSIPGKKKMKPLIFLHGWGGSSDSFTKLVESLLLLAGEDHGDIYVIDFPGFGKSPEPAQPWSIDDYALCVVQVCDKLKLSPMHVVCHSFGGRITALLLAEYPERFVSATCIAPAGIYHKSTKALIAARVGNILRVLERVPPLASLIRALRRLAQRVLGARDYAATEGVMRETFKKVIASDISSRLYGITQPVQLFFGRNDSYVPITDAAKWHAAIRNSTLKIFEDGRHGLQYTHTQDIARDLRAYIQSI